MADFVYSVAGDSNPDFNELNGGDADMVRINALLEVSFRKSDIQSLIDQDECKGIRFYPARDTSNNHSLLATGIHKNGNDLVQAFLPNKTTEDLCLISEGPNTPARNIPVADGATMINGLIDEIKNGTGDVEAINPMANPVDTFSESVIAKAAFSSTDVQEVLDASISEITCFTAKIKFPNVHFEFKTIVLEADGPIGKMIISALPCPPHCNGGGYTNNLSLAT